MSMTEEEARKKWCPHARVVDPFILNDYELADPDEPPPLRVTPGYNRYHCDGDTADETVTDGSVRCVGSLCMAWRWWMEEKEHGYCGLAGKP